MQESVCSKPAWNSSFGRKASLYQRQVLPRSNRDQCGPSGEICRSNGFVAHAWRLEVDRRSFRIAQQFMDTLSPAANPATLLNGEQCETMPAALAYEDWPIGRCFSRALRILLKFLTGQGRGAHGCLL